MLKYLVIGKAYEIREHCRLTIATLKGMTDGGKGAKLINGNKLSVHRYIYD